MAIGRRLCNVSRKNFVRLLNGKGYSTFGYFFPTCQLYEQEAVPDDEGAGFAERPGLFDGRSSKGKADNPSSSASSCSTKTAKADLTLVCSSIDYTGRLVSHQSPTLKSHLCSLHGLLPRDLRKLDGTLKNQLPAILVRPRAILVNLQKIKAIIKFDQVIIFEQQENAESCDFLCLLQTRVEQQQKEPGSSSFSLPFELQVLEIMLQHVCNSLQEELDRLVPETEASLSGLERLVHWDKLRILLNMKRSIHKVKISADSLKNSILEVLNSDADMADMYLSEKGSTLSRQDKDHEEVELLLESYLKMVEEIGSSVDSLSKNIEATEEVVNIGLISQRNELLIMEIKLSIGATTMGMGGLGASIFGMNLNTGLETHPFAFFMATALFTCLASLGFIAGRMKLKRLIQKS